MVDTIIKFAVSHTIEKKCLLINVIVELVVTTKSYQRT